MHEEAVGRRRVADESPQPRRRSIGSAWELLRGPWYARVDLSVNRESGLGAVKRQRRRTYDYPPFLTSTAVWLFTAEQLFSGGRPNASRMSRARHWRGVCRPPKAAPLADAVSVPGATPPDFHSQRLEPRRGAAEAGVGSMR
jgi:hypothetical protein